MSKRAKTVLAGIALGLTTSALMTATAMTAPEPQPYGEPIGPKAPQDTGAGELLLVVVGGVYPTRAEAEAANAQIVFGDLQGQYVVPVAQFQVSASKLGAPGSSHCERVPDPGGADEFTLLAEGPDFLPILPERVRARGLFTVSAGAAPDGSGPLLARSQSPAVRDLAVAILASVALAACRSGSTGHAAEPTGRVPECEVGVQAPAGFQAL
jgi:hypothetical protein